MPDYEELLARLGKLEDENQRLSARIDELTAAEPVNRRGMFKRVALGAAALAVGTEVVTAPDAAAADGDPVLKGKLNESDGGTYLYADKASDYAALTVANNTVAEKKGLNGGIDATGGDYGVCGAGSGRGGVIGGSPWHPDYPTRVTTPAGVVGMGLQGTIGVLGSSDTGEGVVGRSAGSSGVRGDCENDSGYGVLGTGSRDVTGVYGQTESGTGVLGTTGEGFAIHGITHHPDGIPIYGIALDRSSLGFETTAVLGNTKYFVGVTGLSDGQAGVFGHSQSDRGGVFTGGAAAIQLTPGSSPTPPANGQTGDLYVDSAGGLWYCKQGSWLKLA
jgi:hypothetical protein